MIDELKQYAETINCREDILVWLDTTGKKSLKLEKATFSELEHIVDYMNSNAAPKRVLKMSIADAKRKSTEWVTANKKKGKNLIDTDKDIETYHEFDNGDKIVTLKSKEAFKREGFMMSHCLGGYDLQDDMVIYSYRDKNNNPHVTFEVRKDSDEMVQIKGKGNGEIHPKYIDTVLDFLDLIGMKIRESEMRNLGYYYVDDVHVDFLKGIHGAWEQVVEVRGKKYAR